MKLSFLILLSLFVLSCKKEQVCECRGYESTFDNATKKNTSFTPYKKNHIIKKNKTCKDYFSEVDYYTYTKITVESCNLK